MTQEKLTLHRIWFLYNHEAEHGASRFRLLEGCIDVVTTLNEVAIYTVRAVKRAVLMRLLEDCSYTLPPKHLRPSVIPSPDFLPGQLVRMRWYFPGVVSGSTVRILHVGYSGEYRYQVRNEATQTVGWVGVEGVEALNKTVEIVETIEAPDENGPRREHWCVGRYPMRDIAEDGLSIERNVGSRSTSGTVSAGALE